MGIVRTIILSYKKRSEYIDEMLMCNCSWQASLEHKRENGLPSGVVLKLFPVVAVLSQGPDGHLIGPGQGEQASWDTLGHDGEGNPAQAPILWV